MSVESGESWPYRHAIDCTVRLLTTLGSIEDNILITKDGYENLTITPKKVDEIETLVLAN